MKMLEEFKAFILRGNVVDLAVGLIIGGAFSGIVSALVSNILMPPIGWATGGVNFTDLTIELPGTMIDPATRDKPPAEQVTIPVKIEYGKFLQKVIDFFIIGLCLFFVVKGTNRLMMWQKEKDEPKVAEPTPSEKLLTEIRDLLKNKGENGG